MAPIPLEEISFRRLLTPVTPEQFFADYYGKQALHVTGDADRFSEVFSWRRLNDLLDMTGLWTATSLELAIDGRVLPPRDYCAPGVNREGAQAMIPDATRLREFLRRGASMTADYLDTLTPEVRTVALAIESALGASCACNAFISWEGKPGYGPHFDTLQVFALQIDGEKTWRLFEGRVRNAAEVPGFSPKGMSDEQNRRAMGKVRQEVVLRPGDLLYVPQGQYHQALASAGHSLHLSFGARRYTGADYLNILMRELPRHPLVREELPHFDDTAAHNAYVAQLADLVREALANPSNALLMRNFQREKAFERMPGIALPARERVEQYRVRGRVARLLEEDGAWHVQIAGATRPLPAAAAGFARWAAEREYFTWDAGRRAHADKLEDALRQALAATIEAGLVERL